jgi:hypothetical protein
MRLRRHVDHPLNNRVVPPRGFLIAILVRVALLELVAYIVGCEAINTNYLRALLSGERNGSVDSVPFTTPRLYAGALFAPSTRPRQGRRQESDKGGFWKIACAV